MGDSSGSPRTFESLDDDIRSAVDAMLEALPRVRRVVLFGLCDAASAALMYCTSDPRIAGLILANPWVRTPEGRDRSFVRHYYGARLLQRSFWNKLLAGEVDAMGSMREFVRSSLRSLRAGRNHRGNFISRMLQGLTVFPGPVLFQIAEIDLTGLEFVDLCRSDSKWADAAKRPGVSTTFIQGADHTFSSRASMEEAATAGLAWLRSIVAPQ